MVVGSTTLRQTLAILARCRLLVCNDSGIMHLGAALGVPLVAVFGPQSPVKFGHGEKIAGSFTAGLTAVHANRNFSRNVLRPSVAGRRVSRQLQLTWSSTLLLISWLKGIRSDTKRWNSENCIYL